MFDRDNDMNGPFVVFFFIVIVMIAAIIIACSPSNSSKNPVVDNVLNEAYSNCVVSQNDWTETEKVYCQLVFNKKHEQIDAEFKQLKEKKKKKLDDSLKAFMKDNAERL